MKKIRYKDNNREISADFAEDVEELIQLKEKYSNEQTGTEYQQPDEEDEEDQRKYENRLHEIARVSPRSAIIEAWIDIEMIADQLIEAHPRSQYHQSLNLRKRPGVIESVLWKFELISAQDRQIMYKLRQLRNQASHLKDFEISESEALAYIDTAQSITKTLNLRLNQIFKMNNEQ